jgi:hypothetical protein
MKASTKEAFTWSRDGIDRNGCRFFRSLDPVKGAKRRFGGRRPLTGSRDRKDSLSVAINALLCPWELSIGRSEAPT